MMSSMSEEQPSDVLGALPRTRPHRRSDKRGAAPTPSSEQTTAPDQVTPAHAAEPSQAAARGPDVALDHAAATVPPAAAAPRPSRSAAPRKARSAGTAGRARKPRQAPKAAGAKPTTANGAGAKRSATGPAKAKRAGSQTAPRARRATKPEPVAARGPAATESKRPEPARAESAGANPVGTAVQAAAELAEIGLSIGARALRNALARLPRP